MNGIIEVKPNLILIDGDIIKYRLGFRHQKTKSEKQVARDLSFYLKTNFAKPLKSNDYILYLTGKDKFRFDFNSEYKANRIGMEKPIWFKELDNMLLDTYNAVKVTGLEADDALGIVSTHFQLENNYNPVIASLDKDLKQIPGSHWNFVNLKLEQVTELEGSRHLWKQVLTGDMTDNIIGLKGIGNVKAGKILDNNNDPYSVSVLRKYIEVYEREDLALEKLLAVYKQIKILSVNDMEPEEDWLRISTFKF